jgi:hypothetical protein
MECLACDWISTRDPKDPLRLGAVRVKVWLRCGWLGARDPAGSDVVETTCEENTRRALAQLVGARRYAPKERRVGKSSPAARWFGNWSTRSKAKTVRP